MSDPMTAAAGDPLPAFARATGLENWNRFAGANEEFVPIHMDDEAGRAAGFDTAIGMGTLQWSYFHNLLRDWLDGRGRIERIGCKFENPNLKDTTVTVSGTVTAVTRREGARAIDVALLSQDDRGRRLAAAQATLVVADATPVAGARG